MYAADVAFFHKYQPLPPEQLDVYFHVAIEVCLSDFQPHMAQLVFGSGLLGAENATHVWVRLATGLEYEGEINFRPSGPCVTTLLFKLDRVENTTPVYRERP